MSWSFKIGRLAGIDIFVHFTFLILLGWIALSGYVASGDVVQAAAGLLLTGAVFAIIVLHELGHAMAARMYGIATRDIILLPIGGVARLERMPAKPVQELVVALAGPAVNVVLAIFFLAIGSIRAIADPDAVIAHRAGIIEQLFAINIWLIGFNLLPAFPMDGGRVLRALLAMRVGNLRATQVAARIGQGMAIVFAVFGLGLFGNTMQPMLLLIALFVWTGAGQELAMAQARGGPGAINASTVMLRRFAAVEPDDILFRLVSFAQQGFQQDFPVVVNGQLIGLVTRGDLARGFTALGPEARVMQIMRRKFPMVGPDDPAEQGLRELSEDLPVVPVVSGKRLFGLLTGESAAEYVRLRRTPVVVRVSEPVVTSNRNDR
jgi:Zn-dependent protease/predicted transcriptional regulator